MGNSIGVGGATAPAVGAAAAAPPAAADSAPAAATAPPEGRRSGRARRATQKEPTLAERVAAAEGQFAPGPGYWLKTLTLHSPKLTASNEPYLKSLPKKIPVVIFRKLTECEDIEDTKEVLIRRGIDGYLVQGGAARAAVGLPSAGPGNVEIDSLPTDWEVFVSAKSKSRVHTTGTVLMFRYPPQPVPAREGHSAKRRKVPQIKPSITGDGNPEVFFGGQGPVRSIATWKDRYVFCCGGSGDFHTVAVFDLRSGHFIQTLRRSRYRLADMYGLAVIGDVLYIPVVADNPDGEEGMPPDVQRGLVAVALPDLTLQNEYWYAYDDRSDARSVHVYGRTLFCMAFWCAEWRAWDLETAERLEPEPPRLTADDLPADPPACVSSMAGAGRWHFRGYRNVIDLETFEMYTLTSELSNTLKEVEIEVASISDSDTVITAVPTPNEMQCRVFVGYEGRNDTGVAEILVDMTSAVAARAAHRAAPVQKAEQGAASEAAAEPKVEGGSAESTEIPDFPGQPVLTLIRRVSMPEDGPWGYRGPSGLKVRGDFLYVNCSLYAWVSHLKDDGTVETVYSVRHSEGDGNESWDNGPIAVDEEGSFYVTTATADDRYTITPGRTVCCIKRFSEFRPHLALTKEN